MSHHPERKEKNCLNCGITVMGRYCHVCGQENIPTKESFWSLVRHFVYDILHFDGKFFYTLKYMFTKPGFVARQYAEGKRASFLNPIRMYLFTSAVFFLIFFASQEFNFLGDKNIKGDYTNEDRIERANDLKDELKNQPKNAALQKKIDQLLDTSRPIDLDSVFNNDSIQVSFSVRRYSSLKQYDSIQNTLQGKAKDGWFQRKLTRKALEINEKSKQDSKMAFNFLEKFLHEIPYMLFLSLPFFALILKLLYIRRKNFYYSDHVVFTLYHYIFSFILLLLIFGISYLKSLLGWGIFTFFSIILFIAWPVYLFIAMRNFYRQGRWKTMGKFLLLNFLGIIVMIILFVVFLIFSLFQA